MSELTLLILRIGFLLLLWFFIFAIVYALRSDLFGAPVRRMRTDGAKAGGVQPPLVAASPAVQAASPAPVSAPPVSAPLPRAALPVAVHDLPGADANVDLGVMPLTRRQARQQERIRTASVPVITLVAYLLGL